MIPRNFEIEEEQTDLQEEPLCVLCEYAMKVLLQESGIMSNRTIDMAEHAVEMLCSYMPETIEDKCIDLVQEYGDQIIEIIPGIMSNRTIDMAEHAVEMLCSYMP